MIRHPGSDFLQERFLANERPDRAAEKGIHPRMKEVFPAVWTAIRDSSRRMGGERKNEPSANGDAAHIAGRPRRPGKAVRSVWARLSVRPKGGPDRPFRRPKNGRDFSCRKAAAIEVFLRANCAVRNNLSRKTLRDLSKKFSPHFLMKI
jgi:hypothetical protein